LVSTIQKQWRSDIVSIERRSSALTRAIRRGDGDALFEHFTRARAIRKGVVAVGQDSLAPDFGRPHPGLPHEPLPRPYAADEE
jgi:cyclohexadieny/prephenate dehydrogenase